MNTTERSKPIEEMTSDETRVALASARSSYATDEDFEVLVADQLQRVEQALRAQRVAQGARITELETKLAPAPTPDAPAG